jgi:hypothetical protein
MEVLRTTMGVRTRFVLGHATARCIPGQNEIFSKCYASSDAVMSAQVSFPAPTCNGCIHICFSQVNYLKAAYGMLE